jgi:hypothetical protein
VKLLTVDFIKKNSTEHPLGRGRVFNMEIGDYFLSIVGGATGLYGDFENNFEVALFDSKTGNFVTSLFTKRGDDVLPYATIDEINDMYLTIPRLKNSFQLY